MSTQAPDLKLRADSFQADFRRVREEISKVIVGYADLIDGIVSLLHADYSDPVNIGNPAEVTILELANLIRELCASNSEIAYKPLPEDDPKQRRPDITRARSLLHWSPRTDLGVGLEQTIASFRRG